MVRDHFRDFQDFQSQIKDTRSSEIKLIYKEILDLGAKTPKISKMIPDLFGPFGAPVRLVDVIFGFRGVLGILFKTKLNFQNFARNFRDFS